MEGLLQGHQQYNNDLFRKCVMFYDFSEILLKTIRKDLIKEIHAGSNSHILDVACGTGSQLSLLAKDGYKVTGIDLSPDMLKKAQYKLKRFPHVSLVRGDATKMPFKNNVFDSALITFSLHDMPEEVAIPILKEMKRVTKTNGKIFIVEYVTRPINIVTLVTHKLARAWESKYYPVFLEKGLEYYLEKAQLKPQTRKIFFKGIAELYICGNN